MRRAKTVIWPYQRVRELMLKTGDLVTVKDAERRVLMLINPGYAETSAVATTRRYLSACN